MVTFELDHTISKTHAASVNAAAKLRNVSGCRFMCGVSYDAAAVREKRFAWITSICEINASRRPVFDGNASLQSKYACQRRYFAWGCFRYFGETWRDRPSSPETGAKAPRRGRFPRGVLPHQIDQISSPPQMIRLRPAFLKNAETPKIEHRNVRQKNRGMPRIRTQNR